MSEQNIEAEGDVNVTNEAPDTESTPSETPADNDTESGDTEGDDAQQDTGALQE